jgi:hypothetical protein
MMLETPHGSEGVRVLDPRHPAGLNFGALCTFTMPR